jgi:hypothetical protein
LSFRKGAERSVGIYSFLEIWPYIFTWSYF